MLPLSPALLFPSTYSSWQYLIQPANQPFSRAVSYIATAVLPAMRRHIKPAPSPNSAIPRHSPLRRSEPPPASPPSPARSYLRRQSTTTPAPGPWIPERCAVSRSSRRLRRGMLSRGGLTARIPRVCPRITYPRRRGGEMVRVGGPRLRLHMNLRRVGLRSSRRLHLRDPTPAPRHQPHRRNQVCRRVCRRGQTPPPRRRRPHPSAASPQGAAVAIS